MCLRLTGLPVAGAGLSQMNGTRGKGRSWQNSGFIKNKYVCCEHLGCREVSRHPLHVPWSVRTGSSGRPPHQDEVS